MSDQAPQLGWARFEALAQRLIEGWALLGGTLLVAVALMSTWSVISLSVLGFPVPGDFEMVEIGVAVAAFSFLPYCQLKGANVTADIFTAGASPRWVALFGLLAGAKSGVCEKLVSRGHQNVLKAYLTKKNWCPGDTKMA